MKYKHIRMQKQNPLFALFDTGDRLALEPSRTRRLARRALCVGSKSEEAGAQALRKGVRG